MKERTRRAINAAIVTEEKEILLVRTQETWILPGGKPESVETDEECLRREVSEELSGAGLEDDIQFYGSFEGRTPHTGDLLRAEVYLAALVTNIVEASREVSDARWVNNPSEYNLSDITSKIISALQNDGIL